MINRKSISLFFAAIGTVAALAMPRFAAAVTSEDASGVITGTSLGGGETQYDITLSNNSSADNANTTIGTFWFSWSPEQEYMEAVPSSIVAPTGWTAMHTGPLDAGDGNGIQFVAMAGDLLHAGQSLSGFQFDSTESPTELAGPSPFFSNPPETTSAAYVGAPFSDTTNGGDVFNVLFQTTTPPTTGGNGGTGGTGNANPPPGGNTPGGASAVPLPAASEQALAGLIGLGLIAGYKRLAKRPSLKNAC